MDGFFFNGEGGERALGEEERPWGKETRVSDLSEEKVVEETHAVRFNLIF